MRWGQKNDVDFYIDNVTFYDKDGKSMPVIDFALPAGGIEMEDDSDLDAPAEIVEEPEASSASEDSAAAAPSGVETEEDPAA